MASDVAAFSISRQNRAWNIFIGWLHFFHFSIINVRANSNAMSCENSTYFYCNQSLKCISYHRVGDGFVDCYYGEDEHFSTCRLNVSNRFICQSEPTKSLSPVAIWNGLDDCPKGEDETAESMHIWD
ncbi:unnamed protein product [Rotaria magnacalcarata]|uniref:Uncharacterized protein n=1 Tax=Rotaria magnacalcarata TaxID=392030 RepID=A0A8S3HL90_9BILA|nr:unnamed protein product [Rotaria magnacalcarata]